MKLKTFQRLSGLIVLIGGFGLLAGFLIVGILMGWNTEGTLLDRFLPVMGLAFGAAFVGFWRSFELGRLGKASLIISIGAAFCMTAGALLMIYLAEDIGWLLFFISMLAIPIGLLLFGIESFRRRYFGIWSSLPLMVGFLAGPVVIIYTITVEALGNTASTEGDGGFILWLLAMLAFFLWSGIWLLVGGEAGSDASKPSRSTWASGRKSGIGVGIGVILLIGAALITVRDDLFGSTIEPIQPADPQQHIIFHNGKILTMDPERPEAQALAMVGDQIVRVGSDADVLADVSEVTVLIDLQGMTMMPGFVDAHSHIFNDSENYLNMSFAEVQEIALENGITTIGNLYTDENWLEKLTAWDGAGQLAIRTSLYLVATDNCGKALGDWYKQYQPTQQPGEMLRIGGVKIFADGGTCGRPALSYEMRPGEGLGDLFFEQGDLNNLVMEVHKSGRQVAIHAIGDRAIDQAQTAIEIALQGQPNTLRHRIEHNSVIRPDQLKRYGEIGIIPVIFGQYPNCEPFGPPPPAEYRSWEWPYRDLLDANPDLQVAWHGDDPYFGRVRPLDDLYSLVTRNEVGQEGQICQGPDWLKAQTIDTDEALALMTRNAAYALFREEEVGRLKAGYYADLIVLSGDPTGVDPDKLPEIDVWLTMVGGRTAYCHSDADWLCP